MRLLPNQVLLDGLGLLLLHPPAEFRQKIREEDRFDMDLLAGPKI